MTTDEASAVLDRYSALVQEDFHLDDWDITYYLVRLEGEPQGDGIFVYKGKIHSDFERKRAQILLDPDRHDDATELLRTLRHELLHCYSRSLDAYATLVEGSGLAEGALGNVFEAMRARADEEQVCALEELLSLGIGYNTAAFVAWADAYQAECALLPEAARPGWQAWKDRRWEVAS